MSNFDLIQLLKSESEKERTTAAKALGKLGNTNAVPALIEALEKSTGYSEAISIIRALGRLEDSRAVVSLFKYVEDSKKWHHGMFGGYAVQGLHHQIAQALGNIADKDALIEKLHHPNDKVRRVAAEALGSIRII
jgi:HEAT repeat protein